MILARVCHSRLEVSGSVTALGGDRVCCNFQRYVASSCIIFGAYSPSWPTHGVPGAHPRGRRPPRDPRPAGEVPRQARLSRQRRGERSEGPPAARGQWGSGHARHLRANTHPLVIMLTRRAEDRESRWPPGRGPECAGLQLHQGRTVLTEPREGCVLPRDRESLASHAFNARGHSVKAPPQSWPDSVP